MNAAVQRGPTEAENEVDRILRLPVVQHPPTDWTAHLARPGSAWKLRPIQSAALHAVAEARGLFAPIRVGGGKTLIAHLAGVVVGAEAALVFTTAAGVETMTAAFERETIPNFRTIPVQVRSYDSLSQPDASDFLERWGARFGDRLCIVCDEAHKLRSLDAARPRRMGRFLLSRPEVTFCALTGSITKDSLRDFAHLAEWALGRGSPLPRPTHKAILEAWAAAIDADGRPGPSEWRAVEPLVRWAGTPTLGLMGGAERQRTVRRAFNLRLRTAPGVVTSADGDGFDGTLRITAREIEIPAVVADAIEVVRATDTKPNGDAITDDLDAGRIMRQLASGWFYQWHWPGEPDLAWLEARRNWHRHVRRELQTSAAPGYDSPLLVAREIMKGGHRAIHGAWREWDRHRAKRWFGEATPPSVPVWISGFLVADAIEWASASREPVILWYQHKAIGDVFAAAGLTTYGAGTSLPEDPPHTCAASIRTHGVMRNLWRWRSALVVEPPAAGDTWEQLLGRLHREGQKAEVVDFEVYAHVKAFTDAVKKARRESDYIADTAGYTQKLQLAEWEGWTWA